MSEKNACLVRPIQARTTHQENHADVQTKGRPCVSWTSNCGTGYIVDYDKKKFFTY